MKTSQPPKDSFTTDDIITHRRPLLVKLVSWTLFAIIFIIIIGPSDLSVLKTIHPTPTSPTQLNPSSPEISLSGIQEIFIAPATYPNGAVGLGRDLADLCRITREQTGEGRLPGVILQSIVRVIPDVSTANLIISGRLKMSDYLLTDSLTVIAPYFPGGSAQCHFASLSIGTVLPIMSPRPSQEDQFSALAKLSSLAGIEFMNWSRESGVVQNSFGWYASYEMSLATLKDRPATEIMREFYSEYMRSFPADAIMSDFIMAPFTGMKINDLSSDTLKEIRQNSRSILLALKAVSDAQHPKQIKMYISDRTGVSSCLESPYIPEDAVQWARTVDPAIEKINIGINMELFRRVDNGKECKSSEALNPDAWNLRLKYYEMRYIPTISAYELRYLRPWFDYSP